MFKKGVFQGISNREYHDNDAVSRSDLVAVRDVPAGATVVKEETADMDFGQALHTYVLEPKLFDQLVIESEFKGGTTQGHQLCKEENLDKIVLTKGSLEKVAPIASAVWKHPMAAKLLEDYVSEPTVYWQDEGTGLWCKSRPDIMIPHQQVFADLKFVSRGKADPKKFLWSVRDFGYDLQAAWNIMGMKEATGHLYTKFYFIVVERDEPYRVSVYDLDEDWLGDAMWDCMNLLKIVKECRDAGFYPNYHQDNVEGETLVRFI